MEDINLLLSYIETEVLDGKKPFMGNGVIVNGENILNLIKRVRIAFNAVTGEDMVEEANERAKKILALAEQRRAQILDENAISLDAKMAAEKIIEDAYKRKAQMEEQTRANVLRMLSNVRGALSEAGNSVDEVILNLRNDRN